VSLSGYSVQLAPAVEVWVGQVAGLLVAACDTVPTIGLSDGISSFEQALATNRKRNTRYQVLGDRD
jgi:hypothetical protein